jgi:hypothetical protein
LFQVVNHIGRRNLDGFHASHKECDNFIYYHFGLVFEKLLTDQDTQQVNRATLVALTFARSAVSNNSAQKFFKEHAVAAHASVFSSNCKKQKFLHPGIKR